MASDNPSTGVPVFGEVPPEYIPSPDQYKFDTTFGAIRYPVDLGAPPFEKWMLFEVRAGRHIGREYVLTEEKEGDRTIKAVALYLPPDALNSELSVTWDTSGGYGSVAGRTIAEALQTGSEYKPVSTGASLGSLPSALLEAVKSSLVSKEFQAASKALNAVGELVAGSDAVNANNVFEGVSGSVVNPRLDIFFKSVEYRTHEFSFALIPRSLKEAQAIDAILNIFQFYMLPSFGEDDKLDSYFIGYPYEFVISMFTQHNGSSHHINSIDRSVLERVRINHATGTRVSFVDDTNGGTQYYPASTTLTLQFKEVRLQGRNKQTAIWYGTHNTKLADFKGENDPHGGEGFIEKKSKELGGAAQGVLDAAKQKLKEARDAVFGQGTTGDEG